MGDVFLFLAVSEVFFFHSHHVSINRHRVCPCPEPEWTSLLWFHPLCPSLVSHFSSPLSCHPWLYSPHLQARGGKNKEFPRSAGSPPCSPHLLLFFTQGLGCTYHRGHGLLCDQSSTVTRKPCLIVWVLLVVGVEAKAFMLKREVAHGPCRGSKNSHVIGWRLEADRKHALRCSWLTPAFPSWKTDLVCLPKIQIPHCLNIQRVQASEKQEKIAQVRLCSCIMSSRMSRSAF